MNSGKVLLGVLAGVAAGAMIGILFAPEKGSKTRKNIMDKGEDYFDDIKEKFSEFINSLSDKYEDKQHEAEEMMAKGKLKVDELKKDAKNLVA